MKQGAIDAIGGAQASSPPTASLAFSHVGFFTVDIERVASFYQSALQFTRTDHGLLGTVQLIFLSRDPTEHHQIVLASGRPADLPFNLINQISFRVPDLASLRHFHARLLAAGASDVQPVTHGNAISVYCRDPEGNRVEVFMDTPWYCEQPMRVPVDLTHTDDAIFRFAGDLAARSPRYMQRADWKAEMRRRMAIDQAG